MEFPKANPIETIPCFFIQKHFNMSLRDKILLSLSHSIFIGTKFNNFLMSYFVEAFDYCERAGIKQNGCSKCRVVKMESSHSCHRVVGTLLYVAGLSGKPGREKLGPRLKLKMHPHFKGIRGMNRVERSLAPSYCGGMEMDIPG